MQPSSATRSRLAFGLGFGLFVAVGSLGLVWWLGQRQQEEERRVFEKLARQNAELVRQMNLPRSTKLARDLEQLTEMKVAFRPAAADTPESWEGGSLILLLDGADEMIFTPAKPLAALSLADPATRNALLIFWSVSGIVGWLFARERGRRAQSERLAMLGRVATSLAHDIKNPLASIQLHAQLLQPRDEDDQKAVKLIESESEVISGLVNQWLHLANPQPPRLVRLDAAECLRGVLQNLAPQAAHAGVEIENSLTLPFWVMGDAQRLAQAFRNIVLNAIQAMPRGGRLKIERESDTLLFADSGAGFSANSLVHGTDLFFTEKEGGMGVGLNIVASIVQAHGGRLELRNDPKGGAVVGVSLTSA